MAEPLRVVVTGAAGQIAYSLLYAIASGDVFGQDTPITLMLLDIPPMMEPLGGVVFELQDCALPLLHKVQGTSDVQEAFTDVDVAILVGAMPRKEGMERKDLLKANAKIFQVQGKALNEYAKKTVKILVVGNPANTNCLIAARCAPTIPRENFSCLTKLDQNRAVTQVAIRLGISSKAVKKVTIWGNHSSTQYPDVQHAVVDIGGETLKACDAIKDDNWIQGPFLKLIQTRGAAIIKARKLSSAMSAAKAICDHMRTWWNGTAPDDWTSMGVMTTSESHYGIPEGIIYSFPITIKDKKWEIVQGLDISEFSREKMDATAKELVQEREVAFTFLSE